MANNIIETVSSDRIFSGNFIFTAKREFLENKKALLIGLGCILGAFLILGSFLGYWGLGNDVTELVLFCIMLHLTGYVVGSLSFSALKTKEGRISSILLPDTPLDKFLVNWIVAVPILFLIMIAGFYLMEFARIVVFKISNDPEIVAGASVYCDIMNLWDSLSRNMPWGNTLGVTALTGYFMTQSFYVLGSVLWPKLSFIKTFIALWVIQTIFGTLAIVMSNVGWFTNFLMQLHIDGQLFLWILTSIQITVTVVVYILSYYRFKNYEVVYKLF